MKKILLLSAFCSSLLLASSQTDELKMQLQKQSAMIETLSKRLDEMQNTSQSFTTQETAPYIEEDVPAFDEESIPAFEEQASNTAFLNSSSFAQPDYVPNISLVMDTSVVGRNKSQSELGTLGIPALNEGFYGGAGHEGHSHASPNANNGFNFNYAELVISSNVDPYFSLDAVMHFSEEGAEVEEAYFTSTALEGIRIKGGKFLSDFGRLNKQHHHSWSFSDAPLIYQSFLGTAGLNEVGAQFQYTLPTDNYLMVGVEVLQGKNETSFGNEEISINGGTLDEGSAPSMLVAYAKNSFDIGNTTFLPGVSYIYGETRSSHVHEEHGHTHEEAFSGDTQLLNLELTVKHYFDSYSFIALQSEWMRRSQTGDSYHVHSGVTEKEDQKIRQEGLYAQIIYGANQNWRMGVRYDSIYKNEVGFVNEDGDTLPSTPYERYSTMLEYHFSEFSRLRLQYNYNTAVYAGDLEDGFSQTDVHSLILSFNFSIGAHGAHDF